MLHPNWHRIIISLIILIFLLTVTIKILEDKRPSEEPLVIISSANQLTELTTTNNLPSSSKESLVKISNNYTQTIHGGLIWWWFTWWRTPAEKKDPANQFIFYQTIRNCSCSRRFMYPPSPQNHPQNFSKLNSSCSDEGTHYQPNQKVISMSMFVSSHANKSGRHSASYYQNALLLNLIKIRQHYPSHSLRIYTNATLLPNSSWCNILCENEDLFWCDVRSTPSHGNLSGMNFRTWRFLPLGDPTVQIFHCRDLDSLIGYREAAAVQDWLENVGYKAIQVMRDERNYHDIPILAGMWGAQNSRLLEKGKGSQLRKEMIRSSRLKKNQGSKTWDQIILARLTVDDLVMARDVVAYDSYHCKYWSKRTMVRPFPVQRQGEWDFVGNYIDFGSVNASGCPVECRPSYGKDWIYC